MERLFLSTLSLRRATQAQNLKIPAHRISIHALLAESDVGRFRIIKILRLFLSTLSLRRATSMLTNLFCGCSDFYPRSPCGERLEQSSSYNAYLEISIHALLAESDETLIILMEEFDHFYPRSPCGERQNQGCSH